MKQTIENAFKGIKLNDRQKKVFNGVYVDSVAIKNSSKSDCKLMKVNLKSEHIIEFYEIINLRTMLEKLVDGLDYDVIINEEYELSSAYTPESFWTEYKDSIYLMIKDISMIDYSILIASDVEFDGGVLKINCENNNISKGRIDTIADCIKKVFKVRGNFDIDTVVTAEKETNYVEGIDEPVYITKKPAPQPQTGDGDSEAKAEVKPHEDKKSAATAEKAEKKQSKSGGFDDKSKGFKGHGAQNGTYTNKQGDYKGKFGGWKKKKTTQNVDEDCFFGWNCDGEIVKVSDIQEEMEEIVTDGMVISTEEKELKNGKILYTFSITDFKDSISGKLFLGDDDLETVRDNVKKGKFIRVKGFPLYDSFSKEIGLRNIHGIKAGADTRVFRNDDYNGMKRVELHAHTQMSEMDSVMSIKDYIGTAKRWGHKAIAITDHGVVQAFPDAEHALSKDDDLKVIYGVEAYLVDDLVKIVVNDEGQALKGSYVVFDIETTGIGAKTHKIIEFGAVKVVDGEITDRYSTFVNPEVPIPYIITELTSITDADVSSYRTIEEILPEFLEFCKGCVLVAHNAGFDYGFVTHYAKQQGLDAKFTVLDTVALARVLLPDIAKFTLDNVAKNLGVVLLHHHRAVDDAECTAHIFLKMIEILERDGITNLTEVNALADKSLESVRKKHSYHAIILAKNETGRVNLYRLVSESHLNYFNRRPRMPKSLIQKYREGLILGSACSQGELYEAILEEKSDDEIDKIVGFYDYLEIQPIGNNMYMLEDNKRHPEIQDVVDLQNINREIVRLGEIYNKPVVATGDVHFLNPEDEKYRRIMMAGKKFKDADNQPPLYYRTTQEMLNEFDYLGADKAYEVVVANTNLVADMIDYISPTSPRKCPPEIENSDKTLRIICEKRAHEIYGPVLPPVVEERLERELNSIIGNGYAVMYIIAQKLVWKSVEDGYLVGSRGSVGSSFAANMAGITEVNSLSAHYICPNCYYYDFDSEEVKKYAGYSACDMPERVCPKCGQMMNREGHDIPFETFLGFKGNKEPDIDLNFSSEYQSNAHDYTEVIFGAGQTFRAGTVGTLAEKTAFGYVLKYNEEHGIRSRTAEIERVAGGLVGVRRTTGQHPGGIVVLPVGEEINTFTPVQHPANDMKTKIITTHFDYHKIDSNLLKLDILGHQDPTMIRELSDLTGVDASTIPMNDKEVLSLFASTEALGITPEDIGGCQLGCLGLPEFGTHFVINMVIKAKPTCFSDLVRISGLSHGTDVWTNNAEHFIEEGYCTLSSAICTRDDIMIYLIGKGIENETSFTIMESVRKGKGLKPEMEAEMRAHDVPDWYIESCKLIKYMFPKAHAVAYVMMAMRVAYFKVHYPLAYYAAYFSIRATSFNYELMCLGAETLKYHIDDYNRRSNELSDKEKGTLEDMKIVREMYARGFDFMPIDIYEARANRFRIIDGKLMPSFVSIDGLGDKASELLEAEAEKGKFLSLDDIKERAKVPTSVLEKMEELGIIKGIPHSNQMSIFDF